MKSVNYNNSNNATINVSKTSVIFKFYMIFIFCLAFSQQIKAQGNWINQSTSYYDYTGQIYSSETGEDIAVNSSNGDYYVAGDYAKGTASQGIHIVRYNSYGDVIYSANFNLPGIRESVKRILLYGTNVYIICNALNDSTGQSSLLIVRSNSTLSSFSSTNFANYHDATDACLTSSSAIYVSCYKRTGSSEELAVLKLSYVFGTFGIVYSYKYHYNSVNDNYTEKPMQMVLNSNSIYVAGGIIDNVNGKTGTLAIKLNTSLVEQWAKAGTPDTSLYIYNSVAATANGVYVAGGTKNNGERMWTLRRLDNVTGNKIDGVSYNGSSGYNSQALKITLATSSSVIVVGYSQKVSANDYKVVVGKYNADLSNSTYYTTSLNSGSKVTDAVSKTNGITYITGQKYVGGANSSRYMFFYGFNVLNGGNNFYRDSLVNQNGCGNKIILNTNNFGMSIAAVTGFKNNHSNNFMLPEFSMTTRFYVEQIAKGADESNTTLENKEQSFTVYPNPASDFVNITANESIQVYNVIDMQGKTILNGDLSESTFTKEIDLSSVPVGMYFITVNNGKSQKIIKR